MSGASGATGATGLTGPAGPQGPSGVFDPTVLTNTAFLTGLASNTTFVSSLATNEAFVSQIAGNVNFLSSLSSNSGFICAVASKIGGSSNSSVVSTNQNQSSNISTNPPNWTYPAGAKYAAVAFAQVLDGNGKPVTNGGSLLGVFNGTNCCGIAALSPGPNGPLFQTPVYSDQSMVTNMSYQFYNGLNGQITKLAESFSFNNGAITGSISQPLPLHLSRNQTIALNNGWTWISLNVTSFDGTWGTLLSGYTGGNNTVIVGGEGLVTYYNGVWYPSAPSFIPVAGAMYKIFSATATNLTATGFPSSQPSSLSLVNGWNWIGCLDATNTSLQQMLPSVTFSNNDIILSQTGQSSTYYGGIWYNNSGETNGFTISPGCGYLLKFQGTNQTVIQN